MSRKKLIVVMMAFLISYLVFDSLATVLKSYNGEFGLQILLVTVIVLLFFEALLDGKTRIFSRLGFVRPSTLGVWHVGVIGLVLVACIWPAAWISSGEVQMKPGWLLLGIGIFFQGGLGEELIFRGFLFKHIRRNYSFKKSVLLSLIPFSFVHMKLFMTLDYRVAIVSILLSIVISFPLSYLFELSGGSILPPALLHGLIQAVPKLLIVSEGYRFAILWIVISSIVPFEVFLSRSQKE